MGTQIKVGIVGCGFIGSELAKFIDSSRQFKLVGLNDIDENKAPDLAKKLRSKCRFMDLEKLIGNSDLIIESASKEAVGKILQKLQNKNFKNLGKKGKKLIIMSTGGLIGNLGLLKKIKHFKIFLPSGAIAGLDAIKSASGKIKSLTLTTIKSPKSLEGAPYIIKNSISLRDIQSKKTVFEGSLKDAIIGFPQNINVAATLFMASGFERIKVKIVADPNTKFNTHEIKAVGDFGTINAVTKNVPSKNPRTSYLAVLSAMGILKNIKSNINIGN